MVRSVNPACNSVAVRATEPAYFKYWVTSMTPADPAVTTSWTRQLDYVDKLSAEFPHVSDTSTARRSERPGFPSSKR
jgi:hypothetical protein